MTTPMPAAAAAAPPLFASMEHHHGTPLRTPLKQRPDGTPVKQLQQTPVFDSPSSPWSIPKAAQTESLVLPQLATTPPPAT